MQTQEHEPNHSATGNPSTFPSDLEDGKLALKHCRQVSSVSQEDDHHPGRYTKIPVARVCEAWDGMSISTHSNRFESSHQNYTYPDPEEWAEALRPSIHIPDQEDHLRFVYVPRNGPFESDGEASLHDSSSFHSGPLFTSDQIMLSPECKEMLLDELGLVELYPTRARGQKYRRRKTLSVWWKDKACAGMAAESDQEEATAAKWTSDEESVCDPLPYLDDEAKPAWQRRRD